MENLGDGKEALQVTSLKRLGKIIHVGIGLEEDIEIFFNQGRIITDGTRQVGCSKGCVGVNLCSRTGRVAKFRCADGS